MRKFSIHKGKEIEPTKDQIEKNKNFSKLEANYDRLTKRSRRPLYKDPKLFLLLFLLGLVLLLMLLEN